MDRVLVDSAVNDGCKCVHMPSLYCSILLVVSGVLNLKLIEVVTVVIKARPHLGLLCQYRGWHSRVSSHVGENTVTIKFFGLFLLIVRLLILFHIFRRLKSVSRFSYDGMG